MRQIELGETGVRASRLGYGCAQLMARTGRRGSLRLLEEAFDAGITYFDVARSYGYGEAEAVVGRFAATRRDSVTLATKLGIDPPRRSRGLKLARSAAKVVVAAAPRARAAIRSRAGRLVQAGAFDPAAAARSLETSLRELRTDYVDVLLLHDCALDDVTPELLDFLEGAVAAGTVRSYGVATGRDAARAIATTYDRPFVVQVPGSAVERPGIDPPRGGGLVLHSVLGPALAALQRRLEASGELRAQWSEALGLDAGGSELGRQLLRVALSSNPDGVVLFSSRSAERIRSNAGAGGAGELPAERLQAIAQLLRRIP